MLDVQLLRTDLEGVARRLTERGFTLDVRAIWESPDSEPDPSEQHEEH